MKFELKGNTLVLCFEGRVDSSNAPAIGGEIQTILKEQKYTEVCIDAKDLLYISSAGLRVVLSVRKSCPTLKMIRVSGDVYDVLEMTGFTEMITVEKAYRVLSVEGCEVIGQGANGKVYRIDPDTIVKVYKNPDSLPDIQRERELARRAFVLGIPTAIPYDVVEIEGGGYGSVFELLSAKSLAKLTIQDPDHVDTYIGYSIDLLKLIHSTVVKPEDMPDMKQVAVGWANDLRDYLPKEAGEKLCRLMEAVPEDLHMMHGDYHMKNVMVQNGEVLLIDMDTLCHGNPVFEFASIFNAYEGFSELDERKMTEFLGLSQKTASYILRQTFERYFDVHTDEEVKKYMDKARVIGYTRLIRRAIRRGELQTNAATVEHYRDELLELLTHVDDLAY